MLMFGKKNYIFALYGRLIDVYTDENDPYLWRVLASFYSRDGADYTPDALKSDYNRVVFEELEAARIAKGVRFADVRLEKVFLRLLNEAPSRHGAELKIAKKDKTVWAAAVANLFRELSMRRFGVFEGVHETLKTLKSRGAKIYLLSNAQRVFSVPEIEKAFLREYFDAIYISSDYYTAKPEPAFMKTLIENENLDPAECVMIGNDRRSDMQIALSCGVQGVFLNTDGYPENELNEMKKENITVIRSGRIYELLDI